MLQLPFTAILAAVIADFPFRLQLVATSFGERWRFLTDLRNLKACWAAYERVVQGECRDGTPRAG
jgi:hypothetical protein